MKLNIKITKLIEEKDWSNFVSKVYNRPYNFQQQNGCMERGTFELKVPVSDCYDYENETLPEIINTEEMGVKFSSWLSRDPKLTLRDEDLTPEDQYCIELWWERNFYPCLDMVVNDLYKKGLIEEGEYVINIDY
jgi:hypothetical protein